MHTRPKRNAETASRPDRVRTRPSQRGQILVIGALAMLAIVGGVALVLEGGNAYAHQRAVQNAADAAANAGATMIAQKLGGTPRTDTDILAAINRVAADNDLGSPIAYYTDVHGALLTPSGAKAGNTVVAAQVGPADGDTSIPPGAQGVNVGGTRPFDTTFARVIGISQFAASADATAVAGALTGGNLMPIVFPVNITDCDISGDLGTGEENWLISNPDGADADDFPEGQEYILPLCKSGEGSFMILDLDGTKNNCDDEVANPPAVGFAAFPAVVSTDEGNNCAKEMFEEINARQGEIVLIPICDGACVTEGGTQATYHIIRVVALYLDYLSDSNSVSNPACQGDGTLVPIAGNGSSSCVAGWFVRYITAGPVGEGPITGPGAVGIQLKK